MTTLRIGHLSTAYHTAFVIMGGNWVQDRMGIKVEWTLFPTGPAMIQAFKKETLDLGYIGLPPAMIGMEQGLDIKCIGGGHVEGTVVTAIPGFETILTLGSIEATLQQFKGEKIGTPSQGSIHDVILRKLVIDAGLADSIVIENFEWADFIIEAMEDGKVSSGCGTPPLAVLAAKYLGASLVLPPNTIWPYNPSYGIVATNTMIKDQPTLPLRFLQIHEDACNLIRENPSKAASLAVKEIAIVEKAFLEQVFRVSPKYCASLPPEYIESTLAFIPVLQEMGYIKKKLKGSEVFDTRLIKKVHPAPHHYNDPGLLI
ncbi:MAG: ABC transporter substrate-binding protein [Candidatus Thorarchaeota archaeon]